MTKILVITIILGLFFMAGCNVDEVTEEVTNISEVTEEVNIVGEVTEEIVLNNSEIDKENNVCEIDSDCVYRWELGVCATPQHDGMNVKGCEDGSAPCLFPAPPREGVTCTCENNKCITHG